MIRCSFLLVLGGVVLGGGFTRGIRTMNDDIRTFALSGLLWMTYSWKEGGIQISKMTKDIRGILDCWTLEIFGVGGKV